MLLMRSYCCSLSGGGGNMLWSALVTSFTSRAHVALQPQKYASTATAPTKNTADRPPSQAVTRYVAAGGLGVGVRAYS